MSQVYKIDATEVEYRNVPTDSGSSLKTFKDKRREYYKENILGQKIKRKRNDAVILGNLVELLLWEPDVFDDKFHVGTAVLPTGGMLKFVDSLCEQCMAVGHDTITEEMGDIAYVASEYKISKEQVFKKFISTGGKLYFEEYLRVKSNGLTSVNFDEVSYAQAIVDTLKNNLETSYIVNAVTEGPIEVFDQLKLIGGEIDGLPLKGMLDRVIVNHEEAAVKIIDLKVTWDAEDFVRQYYLRNSSYIQGYVYYELVKQWAVDNFPGYAVELPIFLVADSGNFMKPLEFQMTPENLYDAYKGFTAGGKFYKGVEQIIKDLKWSKEFDAFNMSGESLRAEFKLKINYDEI